MTLGTVLTSAMFRVCPGVTEGITLCIADVVAVLAVSQKLTGITGKTYADHAANADTSVSCQTISQRDRKDSLSQRMSEMNRKIASARGVEEIKLTVGITSG